MIRKKLIRIKFLCSFTSNTKFFENFLNNYNIINYTYKNIRFVNDDSYTHLVIINKLTDYNIKYIENKNICKENIVGFSYEPFYFLEKNLKQKDVLNIIKYSSEYTINKTKILNHNVFKNEYQFLSHAWKKHIIKDNIKKRKFNMSIIVSWKKETIGHKYRHILIKKILNTNMDIHIYGNGCKQYGNDKRIKGSFKELEPYKDYKFHICIENIPNTDYYISEKFTNCIVTNSIPIYYGATEVDNIFGKNCCYKLCGDIDKDLKIISDIYNNVNKYIINLDEAKKELFQGKASLPEYLYKKFNKNNNNTIISTVLKGGLGNQLFQIFMLISYCLKYNKTYLFEYSDYLLLGRKRKTYWNNLLHSLKKFTTNNKINLPLVYEMNFHYDDYPNLTNIKFDGYFQSPKYFNNYRSQLFNMIELNKTQKVINKKYKLNFENSISMHFRFDDYLKLKNIYEILNINYYINSLDYIIKNTKLNYYNIYCFYQKVDTNLCKIIINKLKNMYIDKNINFIIVNELVNEDYEELILMSLCNNNIIANSTFSWWGAYFNNNNNKIVCYPSRWFNKKINKNINDLFLEDWIKMDIDYKNNNNFKKIYDKDNTIIWEKKIKEIFNQNDLLIFYKWEYEDNNKNNILYDRVNTIKNSKSFEKFVNNNNDIIVCTTIANFINIYNNINKYSNKIIILNLIDPYIVNNKFRCIASYNNCKIKNYLSTKIIVNSFTGAIFGLIFEPEKFKKNIILTRASCSNLKNFHSLPCGLFDRSENIKKTKNMRLTTPKSIKYLIKNELNYFKNIKNYILFFQSFNIESKLKQNPIYLNVINFSKKNNFITNSNNFETYWNETRNHLFNLCVSWNALESTRLWESLYLGTIPIVINYYEKNDFINKYYNDLPILYIDDINKLNCENFLINNYNRIMKKMNTYNFNKLKLSYWTEKIIQLKKEYFK